MTTPQSTPAQNLPQEEWRPVVGWAGLYEVSSLGNVRSLRTGRLFKRTPNSHGYISVMLTEMPRRARLDVHRLVLLAFVGSPEPATEVNHRNGNKTDNRVENLEWVTRRRNIKHSYETGLHVALRGEQVARARLTEADVRTIRARYAAGGVIYRELAEEYGVSSHAIHSVITGRCWSHVV